MTSKVNGSQNVVSESSNDENKRQSTPLISKEGMVRRLKKSPEVRARFVESHLNKGLTFQIRGLRDREGWNQQTLADKLGSNQNAVSRLENPNYGRPTITTLKKIAAVFDVGLVVRFVPFSQLVDWVSGTPYLDPGLNPNTLDVPSFETELKQGAFDPALAPAELLEKSLAEKISGKDKTQCGPEPSIPVTERASTRLAPLIVLVANPNIGGFSSHATLSRRSCPGNSPHTHP